MQLRDVNLSAASAPITLRQTIVIGDTCLLLKLVCTPAGTRAAHPGYISQLGEPRTFGVELVVRL